MTAALALAFGALVANGLFDVVYKRAAQAGVAPHTLLMTQAWCFTAFIVGYGLVSETLVWNRAAAWGAAAPAKRASKRASAIAVWFTTLIALMSSGRTTPDTVSAPSGA